MAEQHRAKFRWNISRSLEEYGVDYGEFVAERSYHQFKWDLEGMDSPAVIAATALRDLCVGGRGNMDAAVAHALINYLDDFYDRTPLGGTRERQWEEALRILPADGPTCHRWVRNWYIC